MVKVMSDAASIAKNAREIQGGAAPADTGKDVAALGKDMGEHETSLEQLRAVRGKVAGQKEGTLAGFGTVGSYIPGALVSAQGNENRQTLKQTIAGVQSKSFGKSENDAVQAAEAIVGDGSREAVLRGIDGQIAQLEKLREVRLSTQPDAVRTKYEQQTGATKKPQVQGFKPVK
jgi:hypothetical protein